MAPSTRDQLLQTAERLFAERGFYGVSIANIADQHGLTKQALLHHFRSKEKLYGEILQSISQHLSQQWASARASSDDPIMQLRALFLGLIPKTEAEHMRTRLLMRELLDNPKRADHAATWYLKPLLQDLLATVSRLPGFAHRSQAENLALIYQLMGAVNYYGVSGPTLLGIFGPQTVQELHRSFTEQLGALIDAAFKNRLP